MNIEKNEKLLIIAPHADDEVLGCAGLIQQVKKKGGQVFVLILTIGGYGRIEGKQVKKTDWLKETRKVSKFLEIDDFEIYLYKDKIKHLDELNQRELIELIEKKSRFSISKLQPSIVAIPTIFSSHQDHTTAYQASITALRPHPQKTIKLPKMVVSYESPEYYFWSSSSEFGRFLPNLYIPISEHQVNTKIKALNLYKTQMRGGQRDNDSVFTLAKVRGKEIGLEYAEAFHIHRLFI